MEQKIKRRVLLITTNTENVDINNVSKEHRKKRIIEDDSSHYPLGLAYLHSATETAGNEVQTLFLNNRADQDCFNEIKETLNSFMPDVVGFQMLTQNRVSTYRMIEYFNEKHPHVKIIIGGMHATLMYKQLVEKYPYVIIILGEGEITLPELIDEIFKPLPNLNLIDGIAFFSNRSVIKTNPRKLIENLDNVPFPKHEIFFNRKRTAGSIMTTRGCPFNCSFCCLDSISRRKVRSRSVFNVIEEIEWMINKFPQMNNIWIHDDTFFANNDRVIEFCDEIIKRKIKIKFICNGRIKPVKKEMVEKLEKANFSRVLFGLESGDNGILQKCHKGIKQEDVIETYKLFEKTKIKLFSHLIIGLPGENLQTVKETAKLIKKLQKIKYVPNYSAYILTIFPGTEIYEIAKRAHLLKDGFWLTNEITPFFTVENNYKQLVKLQNILMNHISPIRSFTTLTGFIAQFDVIPYHIKYMFLNRKNVITFFIMSIKLILPEKLYDFLKKIFYKPKNKE